MFAEYISISRYVMLRRLFNVTLEPSCTGESGIQEQFVEMLNPYVVNPKRKVKF